MSYSTIRIPTAAHDSPRPRLLIVDDDPCIRELHTLVLRSEGYEVETAADGAAALERLAVKIFDLVVTDRAMPTDGASLISRWLGRQQHPGRHGLRLARASTAAATGGPRRLCRAAQTGAYG